MNSSTAFASGSGGVPKPSSLPDPDAGGSVERRADASGRPCPRGGTGWHGAEISPLAGFGGSDTPDVAPTSLTRQQVLEADRIARRMLDYGEERRGGADSAGAASLNGHGTANRPPAPRVTLRLALAAWRAIVVARLVLFLSPSSRTPKPIGGGDGFRSPDHAPEIPGAAVPAAGGR